tara:strand:+ start:7098 stop:7316 length:219 start_codon:yes stop_codon:yes gene_type:complete
MKVNKTNYYNMGGQMQGQPQMQEPPVDVNALLDMLSQLPPEMPVGDLMEKLLKRSGETPGVNIPRSPSMPMQ